MVAHASDRRRRRHRRERRFAAEGTTRAGSGAGEGSAAPDPDDVLAELALDRSVQGQESGSELLVVASETIVEAARRARGKIMVVDAIADRSAAFDERHDFVVVPSDPHRLVRELSTMAEALERPSP